MQMPHGTFVVVADGRKLMFLRNEGDEVFPKLQVEKKIMQDNPYDRDHKSDAPGRVQASVGSAASAMEEVDFHQLEEDRFAADVAEMLRKRALANDFEKLLIVAPANTIGEMRKHYHDAVEQRLIGELTKDLVNHPVAEIERIIQAEG